MKIFIFLLLSLFLVQPCFAACIETSRYEVGNYLERTLSCTATAGGAVTDFVLTNTEPLVLYGIEYIPGTVSGSANLTLLNAYSRDVFGAGTGLISATKSYTQPTDTGGSNYYPPERGSLTQTIGTTSANATFTLVYSFFNVR